MSANEGNRQQTPADEIILTTLSDVDGVPQRTIGMVAADTYGYHGDASALVMAKLRQRAHQLGADAVVGISTTMSITGTTPAFGVLASGTAVLLAWPDGHGDVTWRAASEEEQNR